MPCRTPITRAGCPASPLLLLYRAGGLRRRRAPQAPVPTPSRRRRRAARPAPAKDGAARRAAARSSEPTRRGCAPRSRAPGARRRSRPSLRVARLTGRISPALETQPAARLGERERDARASSPASAAGSSAPSSAPCGRWPRRTADGRPAPARVPRPARQHALLVARAAPRLGLAHELRHRPRDLPVLPGTRAAAPAARELGPRERARRRVPGRAAQPHARTAAARRAGRSLDRLGALGARRSGFLAWEYYFAYGSGSPPWVSGMTQATAIQALSRGYRALGKARWRAQRPERARRLRAAAADRRLGARAGRAPLPPVLVRARTACSTAACRPCSACATRPRCCAPRPAAVRPRRAGRTARSRRLRHRRLVAVLRARRRGDAQLPLADRGLPRRPLRPRAAPSTAAPASASRATSASRRGSASRRCAGPRDRTPPLRSRSRRSRR